MKNKLLFSAPMAGVSDKPFRQILRKFTSRPLFTEMIGVSSLYHNHHLTRKMLYISDEKDLIVQLVGIEEKYMIHAAKEAAFYGAKGIDINMGCPVKKLITNGSGASLMKDVDTACRLVEVVKNSVSLPVSVKTRIGWDSEHINVVEFAKALENAGADMITIHGRTKQEGYSGLVHQDVISLVKKALNIPVIANGDVIDKKTAKEMLLNTGADGLMVGRGLLFKPWLLAEIDEDSIINLNFADLIIEHLEMLLNYYGLHGLLVARKHLAWYATGMDNKADFCTKVYKEKEIDKVKKIIKDFFQDRKILGG